MKIKYWALAGLAGLAVAVCIIQFRKNNNTDEVKPGAQKKGLAKGERHIRGVMKKSKLSV